MSVNRQMDKEGVVSVLYKILAIKVKSSHSQQHGILGSMPSEVNQKKKNKFHILTHMYGI